MNASLAERALHPLHRCCCLCCSAGACFAVLPLGLCSCKKFAVLLLRCNDEQCLKRRLQAVHFLTGSLFVLGMECCSSGYWDSEHLLHAPQGVYDHH